MARNLTEAEIREVVSQVLNQVSAAPTASFDSTQYAGKKFVVVFDDMNDAIAAAQQAYKAVRAMSVEKREQLITEIRRLTRAEAHIMAEIGVKETGMGKVDHKTAKHMLVRYHPYNYRIVHHHLIHLISL